MRVIEAYHCDFCKKYSKSKGTISRHEKECYHNPETKACASCKHMGTESYTKIERMFGKIKVTSVRPVCAKGEEISRITYRVPFNPTDEDIDGHSISLRHHCPKWRRREIEDMDE